MRIPVLGGDVGRHFPTFRRLSRIRWLVVAVAIVTLSGLSAGAVECFWPRSYIVSECDPSSMPMLAPFTMGKPLPVGSESPDFRLTDLQSGRTIALSDHRERRPVVLLLSSFS